MTSTFFTRYFDALDGDDPLSALELVADDAEVALLFATDLDHPAGHFIGGREELRRFTSAGDMRGWAHYILASATVGNVELALGETRTSGGEVLGTFVTACEVDGEGRMKRYLVGRSPGIRFSL